MTQCVDAILKEKTMPTIELENEDVEKVERLTSETLIIDITLGKWGNSRKMDPKKYFESREIDEEVEGEEYIDDGLTDSERDPDAEMVKMSKRIFKSKEYEAIVSFDSATRKEIKKYCMPSQFGDGEYIVHVNRYNFVKELIEKRKTQRVELVMAFMKEYDNLIEDAKRRLGKEWNSRDYDAPEKVLSKFVMTYRVRSFDVPGTLAIVGREEFEQQRWRTQMMMAEMVEENRVLVRAGIQGVLDHIIEVLTPSSDGKKKIIRDSAYDNVLEAVNGFSMLNIADDKEMAELVSKLREVTSMVPNADMLRKSDNLKESVNERFMAIRDELRNLVRDKPKRTIILED